MIEQDYPDNEFRIHCIECYNLFTVSDVEQTPLCDVCFDKFKRDAKVRRELKKSIEEAKEQGIE